MRVAGAQDLFSAVIQTPKNKIAWLTTFYRNVTPLYSRLRDIMDFIPFFISIFHDSKRERHAMFFRSLFWIIARTIATSYLATECATIGFRLSS